nr:unnamed protein product [Spirometra erinaceieuropaei]
MQYSWTARKAEKIQGYANHNEWKNFFASIKAVYATTAGPYSLRRHKFYNDGSDTSEASSTISDASIARLPQVDTNADPDYPPSLQEAIRTVQPSSSEKESGPNAIPADIQRHGGPQLVDHLTVLFPEMWRQGESPQDFKDATIAHLCIALLNIVGKMLARIRLSCLNSHLGLLLESQYDFPPHCVTNYMTFAARKLQEKCQEVRTHFYSTFMDLTKAFDTPLALCHADRRLPRRQRDGRPLLNQLLIRFQSRVSITTVRELLFADDFALYATAEGDMQRSMDLSSAACKNFSPIINTEKTVFIHQSAPSTAHHVLQRSVNSAQLQVLDNFTYQGSILSRSTKIDDEVVRRISKASQTFDRLQNTIWSRHGLQLITKLKIYKAVMLPSLLCRDGFAQTRRSNREPQGYSENLPEAPADQPASQRRRSTPPTCSRCQRTFRAPIGLVGQFLANCSTRTASTVVSLFTSPPPPTPSSNVDRPPKPRLPSSSSSTASTSAAVASVMPINPTHNSDTPSNTNTTAVNASD